jgi:hypothetical protein
MNIQQVDPRMISISQLRQDIDAFYQLLAERGEALVVKNQDLLFVAISPQRYLTQKKVSESSQLDEAINSINKIRATSSRDHKNVADYVIRMREARKNQWKKLSLTPR